MRLPSSYKVWMLITLGSALTIALTYSVWGRPGLIWGLAINALWGSILYFGAKAQIIEELKCVRLEGRDPWDIMEALQSLCHKARIPLPEVYTIKSSIPTSLVVGRSVQTSALIISDSLLNLLNREDRSAVLAFEVARIKNGEALALGVTGFVTLIGLKMATGLDRILTFGLYKKPHTFYFLAAFLFRGINQLIVSPYSYSEADKLASGWLGDSRQLALVIWKLNSFAKTSNQTTPLGCSHMFIVNPLAQSRSWQSRLFQTHPAIEKRIEKLVGYYPI